MDTTIEKQETEELSLEVKKVLEIARAVSDLNVSADIPRDLIFRAAVQAHFNYNKEPVRL